MGNTQHKLHLYSPSSKSEIKPQQQQEESEGWTFTCEICTEPINKKFDNNNKNCNHPFCTDCMIKYIQVKLEQHVPDIPCPALNCNQSLDILHCKPLIPTQHFVKWCDVLFNLTVMQFDDRVYCPNQNCSELIVNECGGRISIVACPKCKKLLCFRCGVPWHAGFECKEIHDNNDVALYVLAEEKKWRRCPACRHLVERKWGCSIILCRCGTLFCYDCGRRRTVCDCEVGVVMEITNNIYCDSIITLSFIVVSVALGTWIVMKLGEIIDRV